MLLKSCTSGTAYKLNMDVRENGGRGQAGHRRSQGRSDRRRNQGDDSRDPEGRSGAGAIED